MIVHIFSIESLPFTENQFLINTIDILDTVEIDTFCIITVKVILASVRAFIPKSPAAKIAKSNLILLLEDSMKKKKREKHSRKDGFFEFLFG